MHQRSRALLAFVLTVLVTLPAVAQQRPDPDSPRYKGVVALGEFIDTEGDEAIAEFIENRIAVSVRESMDEAELAEVLAAIRAEAAGGEIRGGQPLGPLAAELVLDFSDGTQMNISFELDSEDNDRFTVIRSPGHSIG
jgi:hypothetical protein